MRGPAGPRRNTQYGIRNTHLILRISYSVFRIPYPISRTAFVLACLVLLLAPAWASAPQQGAVAVSGQVVNGTAGGAVPEDLEVTLHVFDGVDEMGVHTSAVSSDGTFRFEDLALGAGESALVETVYQDVVYASDLGVPETGQDELLLPVTIYETTEDPAAVLIAQVHIFISRVDDRFQFGEYYLVSNMGDRTFVGTGDSGTGRRITLLFTLPAGAEALSFDGPGLGERYLEREAGFVDTEPVIPGNATVEVLFSYELSYQEGTQIERRFDVEVNSVVMLLAVEGMALRGDDLISAGTLSTQMGPAVSYTAGPLATGDSLAFAIASDPQATMGSPSAPVAAVGGLSPVRSAAREISVGLVALATAVVVVYLLWVSPGVPPLPEPARPLVESIVALEADFEAGQVSERDYQRRRRSLEQQLRPFVGESDT
jgi:hypothetical protein